MSGKALLERHTASLAEATGLKVEVIEDGTRLFVLTHKYRLPPGIAALEYSDILFIGDWQYSMSAMDMFWTEPELVRSDGTLFENSDSLEDYLGRRWRRFSYHRQGTWNANGNPLLDHFALMETRWTGCALK